MVFNFIVFSYPMVYKKYNKLIPSHARVRRIIYMNHMKEYIFKE